MKSTTSSPSTASDVIGLASWLLIPSWLGSVLAHAGLLLFAIWMWQPTERGDFLGEGGDSFRTVGIRMDSGAQSSGGGTEDQEKASANAAQAASPPNTTTVEPEVELPRSIHFATSPVTQPPPVIGIASAREFGATPPGALIKATPFDGPVGDSGSASSGSAGGGTGGPSATFGGITGEGKRFVYLIDCSSSMETDRALRAAKVELLASLQKLNETQSFQIIFYNTDLHPLSPPNGRGDMFQATDVNRLRVEEQIRSIQPSQGTRHFPAIEAALNFKADVIFILTDGAADTPLDYKDLNIIRQKNRAGTRIHCVEIGSGRESPIPGQANFLRVLSSQNQGRYVYRSTRDILPSPTAR